MKHLFIINPVAYRVKRKVETVKKNIDVFFKDYPGIEYEIFITEWSRDAVSYIRKYINKRDEEARNNESENTVNLETIRVHAIGGTGLFFEVVSGVIGFKNVEIAAHPFGQGNLFLRYFSPDYKKVFNSMKSQVFCKTVPMDVITNGNHNSICNALLGIEALATVLGYRLIENKIPMDISFALGGLWAVLKGSVGQQYTIYVDDREITGNYAGIMIANSPCYSTKMYPAIDAHPDDGKLDIYLIKKSSIIKTLVNMTNYCYGRYRRIPEIVTHYVARKVKISSNETIYASMDGEILYTMSSEFEVIPGAVNFVLPDEIDLSKLPKIYNYPEEGLRGRGYE